MSRRHRPSDAEVLRPGKEARRQEHHRERQATRALLAVADPEDVVAPQRPHDRPINRPVVATSGRKFRHWKAAFWKRRTAERHRRNEEWVSLIRLG